MYSLYHSTLALRERETRVSGDVVRGIEGGRGMTYLSEPNLTPSFRGGLRHRILVSRERRTPDTPVMRAHSETIGHILQHWP